MKSDKKSKKYSRQDAQIDANQEKIKQLRSEIAANIIELEYEKKPSTQIDYLTKYLKNDFKKVLKKYPKAVPVVIASTFAVTTLLVVFKFRKKR